MLTPLLVATLLTGRLASPVTERAEALAAEALRQGGDVRAAAPLVRLHQLLDEVDDLNLLAEPYAVLLARPGTDPGVRSLARLFLAEVERARGRTVKAAELIDDARFIQDWQVVGAFDNEGKGGCDTDFGPEAALDLKASYPAGAREVGWRTLHAKSPDGSVDLSLALRPNTEAVAYAATWLAASAETKAVLALGASGGLRLFVNGQLALSSNRYNLPRADQHRVRVNLRKGLNRVLLKVCQLDGPLGFSARLEGGGGAVTVARPETVPPLARGGPPQPQLLPTVVEALEARVRAAPADARLRGDYATVLHWFRAWPSSEQVPAAEAERAALTAPQDVELQVLAAELHAADQNDRRRFLERALALDPGHAFARALLGQLELSAEHPERALEHARHLRARFPDFGPGLVLHARALDALGQKTAAAVAVEEAFARLHHLPPLAREAVASARRAGRLDEAVGRARGVLALRFDDVNTRRGLAGLLVDLGRVDDAAEQFRKVLALDPFDLTTRLRLAELLSANGRLDEARQRFDEARRAAPDDPEVPEREGRALLHANLRDAALSAFQRSLQLRPQNPALKEALRILEGGDTGPAAPEALPLPRLLDEARSAPSSRDDAVVLAEVTHVRVQASGLASRFQQVVVKVETQRGVEAWRSLPITWSPDRQEVRVLKARVTKPDGSVVDAFGEDEHNLNEPWTGMYYDARARVLSFPALAPGDVLEVQWRLDDTSADNLLSDYWGDVDAVQGVFPKRQYRYVVDMPRQRPLSWNRQTLPRWLRVERREQGDRATYHFAADDVPRLVPEPGMPGWAETASPLHLSTYQDWEQVGRYYWGLVREQLVPNDELRRAVDTALAGVDRKDTARVVAALYGYVVSNTRYVALEFGIHGYKPYRVDRVLARKFGDCKDKASLLHAMLRAAGVESRLVLLRMRNLGALSGEVASLAAFNHAIAYVPALDRYLDGTAEFHGSRELPGADRGANVLVVEPDGASRFLTTPEAAPEDNATRLALDVTLAPDGSAATRGTVTAHGEGAPELRRAYQAPATRVSTFEQQWAQTFPGLAASEVSVGDLANLEAPVSVHFAAAVPRYAEAGPGLLRFFPFGAGRAFTQALAPLTERASDLSLPGAWVNEFEVRYALPPGWTLDELPPATQEDSPFGSLRVTATRRDDRVVLEGRLVMARSRIEAKDYPAFRAWLLRVDQAFGRKLVARQPGETARR